MRSLPALGPLALLVVLVTACGTVAPDASTARTTPGAGWQQLPDPPLSSRDDPLVATISARVVVVGGYDGPPCPPNADCVSGDAYPLDGALWDLAGQDWSPMAPAPVPLQAWAPAAVVGDDLYVLGEQVLLSWNAVDDRWREVRRGIGPAYTDLVADGTRLVLASGTDEHGVRPDLVLDTVTGTWSQLPAGPLTPSFDRTITATPSGLVLTAKPLDPDGGPADPALVHAAVLASGADVWRPLPVSGLIGAWRWSWTGSRLVDPSLGGADGGEVHGFGRTLPFGGRLDPATGEWSALPDAPAEGSGGWPVEAAGGPLVAAEGWVYDDATLAWSRLSRPPGAPVEPGPAAWVDNSLVVVGGQDWDLRSAGGAVPDPADVRSTSAWVWRPAG